MKRRSLILALSTTAAVLTPSQLVLAQTRPIRLIVPYAAGGPIDVTARLMAERVKDSLGPVIIENRPGESLTRSAISRAVTSIGPPAA